MYPQLIQKFLEAEKLPASYAIEAERWFIPFIEELALRLQQRNKTPLLLGINGAQGTGKSTLASLITAVLQARGFKLAQLSIDDFYLSKKAREALAETVHPLLGTRGVPGTHNTELLLQVLQDLRQTTAETEITLPRFDKSTDDCAPQSQFGVVVSPIDLVILEGWFVGAEAEDKSQLQNPVNSLEAEEDRDGRWRQFTNSALEKHYQPVFALLDQLLMLQAPSFEQVYQWRGLQEEKLRNKAGAEAAGIMNDAELKRFIQHYERLTRHCLKTLPHAADSVFVLAEDHRVVERKDRGNSMAE